MNTHFVTAQNISFRVLEHGNPDAGHWLAIEKPTTYAQALYPFRG